MSLKVISYQELKKNTVPGSYWIVIDGKVHNVTSYLVEHPGGGYIIFQQDDILKENSGTDATELFKNIGHSDYADSIRKSKIIGVIDQETQEQLNQEKKKKIVLNIEEVQKHSTEQDNWIVINNKVYDVTKFQHKHPGGKEVMMSVAGTDASESFEAVQHSKLAYKQMEEFLIGDYINEKKDHDKQLPKDENNVIFKLFICIIIGFGLFYFQNQNNQDL